MGLISVVWHRLAKLSDDHVLPRLKPHDSILSVLLSAKSNINCPVQTPTPTAPKFVGARVLHKFGADMFCLFFSGFHLPENGMFKPVFLCRFWCTDFCADFCTHFCADFWCADFCADFLQIFLRRFGVLKNRCSRVTQKCVENLRKNLRRPNGPARGGAPHSISAFSSRQHVTQSPPGPRTQGEHVSVHHGIFGPKGMLRFAPRFFKNKNLRKIALRNTSLYRIC